MAKVIKTDCGLCVNCCGLDVHVENDRIVKIEGTKEHWLNKGEICPKGEALIDWVYSRNRLKYPMKKVDGRFQRISWDQAMEEIAAKLNALKEKYGSHTLMLWTGSVGVEHIEMSYFMQRFRGAFGSPHFYNAEGICFRTRILSRQITFGRCPAEEPYNSEVVILWGHNSDASYFTEGRMLRERVKNNGMKLIVIDPRRIPLANYGIYLQPRPGTDCAIALAMMNVIIAEDLWDKEFVEKWTIGFDKLIEHVKAYTPEKMEIISGVPASEIRHVARLYATAKGACILEGVGSTNQQINGLQTHRASSILQAITGNIDVPGGWVTSPMLPLTDMRLPVEEQPLGAEEFPVFYQFGKRPAPYGVSSLLTEAIIKEKPYPIKAFINSGGNPAVTFPDTKRFMEAMKNIELNVCIDPYMTETAVLADYVLPACTFLEETGVGGFPYCLTFCTPYVMLRKKCIEPLYESKPVWWIYSAMGRALGYAEHFPWNTDEEVAEFLFSKSVISYQKLVDNPGGCYFGVKEYKAYEKIGFSTESGKVELYSKRLEEFFGFPGIPTHVEPSTSPIANPALAREYPEILITGARQLEYIDAQMRYLPRLRVLRPEAEADIHPVTAKKYDIIQGELIGVETPRGMIKIKANVTKDIKEGVISIPHGWATANVNILLDCTMRDPISGYMEMRGVACRVVKLG